MSKHVIREDGNLILKFKDEVSAFNGLKKAKIKNKGRLSNHISAILFKHLELNGIPTHFIELVDDTSQSVHNVEMIPLEIIIRNIAAGPWLESLGFAEGALLQDPIIELCFKSNKLSDPILHDSHIVAMGVSDQKTLDEIKAMSMVINSSLIDLFDQASIKLVDIKLEFGIFKHKLVLADSLSPDTLRLWDKETNAPLDKDVFRKDLGKLDKAYETVLKRLEAIQ